MIYRNLGSLGLVLRSCGLGKQDIRSLSFLCPFYFCFVFFPLPSFHPFLSCFLKKLRSWNTSSHLWFNCPRLFVAGSELQESAELRKRKKKTQNSRCCRLLRRQRAGPAVWLRRESIYILGMPRSWLGLSCTVLCEHGQWKVWSPGQKV